jgi:tRNA 2-thiocytidine biosynthesis protein TtcA
MPGQGHQRKDLTRRPVLFFPIRIMAVLHGKRNIMRQLKQREPGAAGGARRASSSTAIISIVELEKVLLRKAGDAIHRFKMIRDGDRVAVALSGGKDSATLLEVLLLLARRAPIDFSVCAFTVEQGKFLRPIEPLGEYLKQREVAWTYYRDAPSLRLLDEQPDHGCDLCSRYRRRAVYEIARGLGANVIAFGHTADDFCEALLRNTMFTGRLSALPPVTHSRDREFRLIRPLVYVTEDLTRAYAEALGIPLVPCGCSQKTGTVRRSLRGMFQDLERDYPHLKENILSAMGNLDPGRLLDTRFLDLEGRHASAPEPFPIVTEPLQTPALD